MRKSFSKLTASFLAVAMAFGAVSLNDGSGLPFLPGISPKLTIAADNPILEEGGLLESAYVRWSSVSGADGFTAYVKSSSTSTWTKLDNDLIRKYGTYFRADALGLPAGTYQIKIVPCNGTVENQTAAFITGDLTVKAYDRSGFTFSSNSTYQNMPGAYNADGSLKSGARVIYVNKNNAKTVTCDIVSNDKGGTTTYTGFQDIIYGYQKGYDHTPITFRIVGGIEKDDLDKILSSAEGIQIKGSKANTEMNMTIEGVGNDAFVSGFGFLIRNSANVEFRNFAVMNFMDDGISMDTDNSDIWVHNMDVFYGQPGSDADQKKGDGSIDIKGDSKYITVSYCHFWDSGKSSLCGMKSESGPNYITYHHNWYDHSDSRHPRIRTMSVHVYNNYFDGNSKYGVGAAYQSDAFVESNYFNACKYPMLISRQGSDIRTNSKGTFSGEDGGIIKAYNNKMVNVSSSNYTPYTSSNTVEFDSYEVANRSDKVPSTVTASQGGHAYNNFDTSIDLGVKESNITAVDNVPSVVTQYAGVPGNKFVTNKSSYTGLTSSTSYDVDSSLQDYLLAYYEKNKGNILAYGGIDAGGEVATEVTTKEVPTEATTAAIITTEAQQGENKTTEAQIETTTEVQYDYNIELAYNDGYNFSQANGYLVYDRPGEGIAYTTLREKRYVQDDEGNDTKDTVEKDITFNEFDGEIEDAGTMLNGGTATVLDNDKIVMTKLNLPFEAPSEKYVISGRFTPSVTANSWTILQLHDESAKTEYCGIRTDSGKYKLRLGTDNNSLTDTGVKHAAKTPVDYKITVDTKANTVTFNLSSGGTSGTKTLTVADSANINMLRFVTATQTARNIALDNISVYDAEKVVSAGTGDVYKDGKIDAVDAAYLLKYLNGADITSELFDITEGNCNGDDFLNLSDVIYILNNTTSSGEQTDPSSESSSESTTFDSANAASKGSSWSAESGSVANWIKGLGSVAGNNAKYVVYGQYSNNETVFASNCKASKDSSISIPVSEAGTLKLYIANNSNSSNGEINVSYGSDSQKLTTPTRTNANATPLEYTVSGAGTVTITFKKESLVYRIDFE